MGGRLGEKPPPSVKRGASSDVAELEADLEAELEAELESELEAESKGELDVEPATRDCAAVMPAGMELIPGFEDTIDSHFMAALLQGDATSQPRAAKGVEKGASGGGGEGEDDGCGVGFPLDPAQTPLKGFDASPAAAASDVAGAALGGPTASPGEELGLSPESVGLAKKEREGDGQGGSSVDGPSITSDGLEAAWRSDDEEGEVVGATPSPAQPPPSPVAPAESAAAAPAAAAESPSPSLPSPPPLPPQPLSVTEPPLPTAAVAAAAASPSLLSPQPLPPQPLSAAEPPLPTAAVAASAAPPLPPPSLRLAPSMTPPVITPACDTDLGAEKESSSRVIERGERKRENQEDEEEEEKEPRKRNPAAAPTPHKTARERAREEAAAVGKKKAAPVTASTRAENAAEQGVRTMFLAEPKDRAELTGEPCPDVAVNHRTARSRLGGADGKVEGGGGTSRPEGGASLPEAAMAPSSFSVPGVEVPGGVLNEAAFDAGASVNDWELPSAAEPRTLPRKVSLRFVPRDQVTKDRVAERDYLPFQKLKAPVSGFL